MEPVKKTKETVCTLYIQHCTNVNMTKTDVKLYRHYATKNTIQ